MTGDATMRIAHGEDVDAGFKAGLVLGEEMLSCQRSAGDDDARDDEGAQRDQW